MTERTFTNLYPTRQQTSQEVLALLAAQRIVKTGVALSSAARTTSTISGDISVAGYKGIALIIYITAASGTGGLTPIVQIDDALGNFQDYVLATTARTSIGWYPYQIYPGVADLSTTRIGFPHHIAARTVRIRISHGDATSYTYGVAYALLP